MYLVAFWSLAVQIRGLVGRDGILPAAEYLSAARSWADFHQVGLDRFRLLPTLCWLGTSDRFLGALSISGVALAALLVAGVAPALLLPLLWAGYLSLSVVCRDFLSYQWDGLLLETGFLATFIAPLTRWDRLRRTVDPPPLARWLLWWLLFRLLFGSGVVKLGSHDPTWHGLTALAYHYETQPLPTPPAWYAYHLPLWAHKGSTAAVLGLELVAPWLIFTARRPRLLACAVLLALQALIWFTGNYGFFNLLTMALCVLLIDDATIESLVPVARRRSVAESARRSRQWPAWVLVSTAVLTLPVSIVSLASELNLTLPGSALVESLAEGVRPFRSVNAYGLFAVMTTARLEVIVEGSNDGVTWREYEFKYQPGDLRRRPRWIAPWQPRLDWQMWFAALDDYDRQPWFQSFCARLLEGSPSVLALLERDPFSAVPPKFVRGVLYQYHFSGVPMRRAEGIWWTRVGLGQYSPELSRSDAAR